MGRAAVHFPKAKLPTRLTQEDDYTCGTVVLRMLLFGCGITNPPSDSEIILAGGMTEIEQLGSHVGQFSDVVRKTYPKLRVLYRLGASISDLFSLLSMKYLPCVGWQGIFDTTPYISAGSGREDGEDGHYSIVTGVNFSSGYLSLRDPSGWFLDPLLVPIQTFERRWWDLNKFKDCETQEVMDNRDDRLVFVVVPNSSEHLIPLLNLGFVDGRNYTCR